MVVSQVFRFPVSRSLYLPDPLSTTRAATSSSAILIKKSEKSFWRVLCGLRSNRVSFALAVAGPSRSRSTAPPLSLFHIRKAPRPMSGVIQMSNGAPPPNQRPPLRSPLSVAITLDGDESFKKNQNDFPLPRIFFIYFYIFS